MKKRRFICTPPMVKVAASNLFLLFLFVISFFFTSCEKKEFGDMEVSSEELKDLEYFLNVLLLENHGAFVTLGSKPMSSMTLIDIEKAEAMWEKKYAEMSQDEKKKWDQLLAEEKKSPKKGYKRNPYKGWLVWQRLAKNQKNSRYLITVEQQAPGSAFYDLLLVDIPKTSHILSKYSKHFEAITGQSFDPLAIIYELSEQRSDFWDKVFQLENHMAKGLLFGYGEKNARFFENQCKHFDNERIKNMSVPRSFENDVDVGQGSLKNFTIPRFEAIDAKYVKKYESEKKEIERYYRDKNFLKASMAQFFKK